MTIRFAAEIYISAKARTGILLSTILFLRTIYLPNLSERTPSYAQI